MAFESAVGGAQTEQGSNVSAARERLNGAELFARYRHPERWYFFPAAVR